jgi:hypothetical protein
MAEALLVLAEHPARRKSIGCGWAVEYTEEQNAAMAVLDKIGRKGGKLVDVDYYAFCDAWERGNESTIEDAAVKLWRTAVDIGDGNPFRKAA